jgi:VanZ family protein
MKKIMTFLGYWLPPLALMALIFYLSSRASFSISPKNWLNFLFFKLMHFAEYGLLLILFYRAAKNTLTKKSQAFWGIISVILTLSWAISDEIHQSFVPTRSPALRDVLIDLLGMMTALFCLWILLPKAPKKLKTWAEKLALV